VVALQRRRVAQKEVGDQDGHGAPHVRVGGHERVAGTFSLIGKRGNRRSELLLQAWNPAPQVKSHVHRHLLVARPARVQPPPGIADPRHELALDKAVHVLVWAVHPGRITPPLLEDFGQPLNDLARVFAIDGSSAVKRARPRQAPRHVVFEEAAVEGKRDAKVEHGWVGSSVETA
jgi:hypothetical protein